LTWSENKSKVGFLGFLTKETVMDSQMEHAKQPVSVVAGPYGHPFHPILVTVPIGAWVASLVFDIASRFNSNPGFLIEGSRWLIAIGVIGGLVAAVFGTLDLLAIPKHTKAFLTGRIHAGLNLTVTVAYALNFFWRGSASSTGSDRVANGPLTLSVVALLLLGVSGYLGGKLAYHYGVRVAAESVQAQGYVDTTSTAPHAGESPQAL
jgi:uncharacterized membrane protein